MNQLTRLLRFFRQHTYISLIVGIGALTIVSGAVLLVTHDTDISTPLAFAAKSKLPLTAASSNGASGNAGNTSTPSATTPGTTTRGSSNSTSNKNTTGNSQSSTTPMTASVEQLLANPSTLTLGETSGGATFEVSTSSHTSFPQPQVSYSSDLYAYVAGPLPPTNFGGGLWQQPSWQIIVRQTNFSSTGTGHVTVTSYGHTVTVPVSYRPVPTFSTTRGSLIRTDGTNTITYTANFTLNPVNWIYGTPTLTMRLYNTSACINTADLNQTIRYSGQNAYSMTCVVNRLAPYVPGSGSPPPPASELNFTIDVAVQLPDGNYVDGEQPFGFTAPAPYNQ